MKKLVFLNLLAFFLIQISGCATPTQYDYCIDYCLKSTECISGFNITSCENSCLRIKEDNPFSEALDEYGKILDPHLKLCSEQKYCEQFLECTTAYKNGEDWPPPPTDNSETEPEQQ